VAAAVLLMHPGKLNQATLPSAHPQIATTAPPASGSQIASSPVASSPVASSPTDQYAGSTKTDEARPRSDLRLSKELKAGQVVTPSPRAESGILLADNKKDSRQADKLSARTFEYDARSRQAATETVEVSGAAAAITSEPSTENALMARNETPRNDAPAIEKAKPALQEREANKVEANNNNNNEELKTQAAAVPGPAPALARNVIAAAKLPSPASPTLAHNVIWAITGGVLQRSLDNGQSWQDALHPDHPLLCYTSHDEDIWTGGEAGTLFHSADGGATWVQVQPSAKARRLGSNITHIELRNIELRNDALRNDDLRDDALRDDVRRSPAEIILSTSTNEIWSTADGGKTWDKK
jgi:hypothetical protein